MKVKWTEFLDDTITTVEHTGWIQDYVVYETYNQIKAVIVSDLDNKFYAIELYALEKVQ